MTLSALWMQDDPFRESQVRSTPCQAVRSDHIGIILALMSRDPGQGVVGVKAPVYWSGIHVETTHPFPVLSFLTL
jgi:hypothetical protein